MNILLTCAGRRNYLVQYFACALGSGGRVFAADAAPHAPALQDAARGFVVPTVDHPGYTARLREICRENAISLLVPLNDLELPLLARERECFAEIGTTVLVSTPKVIDTCFDKWATAYFLFRAELPGPKTWRTPAAVRAALREGELKLPVILKPRWGSASIGIEMLDDEEDIEPAWRLAVKRLGRSILANASAADREAPLLFQERLDGQEYGLDVINDLAGRHLCTFVRRKIGMRAGETDRAAIVRHPALEALGERIGRALGHVGILDCDVFDCGGKLSILEMNPRFGGGYPFTHEAGANVPAILIALAQGKVPGPECFAIREGCVAAKCDRLVRMAEVAEAEAKPASPLRRSNEARRESIAAG